MEKYDEVNYDDLYETARDDADIAAYEAESGIHEDDLLIEDCKRCRPEEK